MQQVTSFLHKELQQHGIDTPELWSDSDAIHLVMRVTHQDGKIHLLALLSILHALIHRIPTVILFPSTEAQHHFRQLAEEAASEAQQLVTESASADTSAPAALLHQEQFTFIPGCPVTIICPQALHPNTLAPPEDLPSVNAQHQARDQCPAGRVVLCIMDHDLCTSDAQLHQFWGHLCQQQQQQQKSTTGQQPHEAGQSAASLLGIAFGHLGSLWRIVSMTVSLPGLASTLTGTSEPDFSTHFLQTTLPQGCTAHPLMLPQQQDMRAVQRRFTPATTAVSAQHAQHEEDELQGITWYSLYPGLLQWLTILTESANGTHSADGKLIMVVGKSRATCTDDVASHAQASGLSLVALELDVRGSSGREQVQSMLTTTPKCFRHFVEALHPSMLAPLDKASLLAGFQKEGSGAKLLVETLDSTPQQEITAVLQASASAGLTQHKVIHGIVFVSWATLGSLQAMRPMPGLTDLYLCNMADAVAPDSQAPLTAMAAHALQAVSTHLCGAPSSDKQAPRLWMDTAWHMLMDDYLTLSHQRFHCKDVEDVTEGLEESLLKKFASQASPDFKRNLAGRLKLLARKCSPPTTSFQALADTLSSPLHMSCQVQDKHTCQPCVSQRPESIPPTSSTETLGMPSQSRSATAAAPLASLPVHRLLPHPAAATANEQQPPLQSPSTVTSTPLAAKPLLSQQLPEAPLNPVLYHTSPSNVVAAALTPHHLSTPVIDQSGLLLPTLSKPQGKQSFSPVHAWVSPQTLSGCDMHQPASSLPIGTRAVAAQAAVVCGVMVPVTSPVVGPQVPEQVQAPAGQNPPTPHSGPSEAAAAGPLKSDAEAQFQDALTEPSKHGATEGLESARTAATPLENAAAAATPLHASPTDGILDKAAGPRSSHSTAASPSVSASTSAFTASDTPSQSAEEASAEADREADEEAVQDVGQCDAGHQVISSSQPPLTPQWHAELSSDAQQAHPVLSTVDTAEVGSKSVACQAQPVDSVQQKLGRDASIAQVLASLNCLPTHSGPSQLRFVSNSIPSHQTSSAHFSSVSLKKPPQQRSSPHSNLSVPRENGVSHVDNPVSLGAPSQQTGTTQHESAAQCTLSQQAETTHLGVPTLAELPQQLQATQPLSPVSVSHSLQWLSPVSQSQLPQPLSPGSIRHLPQQAGLTSVSQLTHPESPFGMSQPLQQPDAGDADSGKMKGLPQMPSLAQFRAVTAGPLPLQAHAEQPKALGSAPVSLQHLKMGMPNQADVDKSLEQRQDGANIPMRQLHSMQGNILQRPRPTAIKPLDTGSPTFPWQQSLGLISPGKIGTHTVPPAAAQPSSHGSVPPQELFSHPGRQEQLGLKGFDPAPIAGLSGESYSVGQHISSNSSGSSILPGSQLNVSWQPTVASYSTGFGLPSHDRAGTMCSAFSAWAPAQTATGHSTPSVQSMHVGSISNAGFKLPSASRTGPPAAAAPSQPPSAPSDPQDGLFSFPTVISQIPGVVPSASHNTPTLPSGSGLSYGPLSLGPSVPGLALPGQFAAHLPATAVPIASTTAGMPALNYGVGAPPFSGLLTPLPQLPGMLNLPSQWPSNFPSGAASQPPPFLPFGYSISPYPIGFGHLPPQLPLPLPFHLPPDPHTPSSTASTPLPNPNQGLNPQSPNMPYHLPPYPPNPLQTLIASQPPFYGQLPAFATDPALQIKQEPGPGGWASQDPKGYPPQQHLQHGQTPQQVSAIPPSWEQLAGLHHSSGGHAPARPIHEGLAAAEVAHLSRGSTSKAGQKASGVKRERQRDAGDVPQITLPGQPSKGNKRCKLGPTEQLRVVVRQILAGVSREAKKHIKTSTASKGDLQVFIQLALGDAFDPTLPPDLAVPKALSQILKQDVTKAQADQWLRRSNSGAPYFVSPDLEEKLQAAKTHWPPCNEALLRNFKWDTSVSAAQQEPDGDLSFSPSLQHHAQLLSPELQFGLQPVETRLVAQSLSSGSHPSSQGQSSFAGTPTAGGHLY